MRNLLMTFLILMAFTLFASANTYQVTNVNSGGPGSLRTAIDNANLNAGADTITFSVSGAINLLTPLPTITDNSTFIIGPTAPAGARSVEINGINLASGNGITVSSGYQVHIEGLTIRNFYYGYGIDLATLNSGYHVILNNEIDNCHDGVRVRGAYQTIMFNTITRHEIIGIYLDSCNNISILVNYIGTNSSDHGGIGNVDGITGSPSSHYVTIESNVISGNSGDGIITSGSHYGIYNNKIGTTSNGLSVLPNTFGVQIVGYAHDNDLGGAVMGQSGNVISGNEFSNVVLGINSHANRVRANVIGADVTGSFNLGGLVGINLSSHTDSNFIGGPNPDEGNLISGNGYGIKVTTDRDHNMIGNNWIGLDSTGSNAIPNIRHGIYLEGSGIFNIYENTISGNDSAGIKLIYSTGNAIHDNRIGLAAGSSDSVGNGWHGIFITDSTFNNTIGPDNIIAFNGGDGISMTMNNCLYNEITQNSIYNNVGLGIDLGDDGVSINDAGDTDTGPNTLLNYPEISSMYFSPSGPYNTILYGTACANCRVEVFDVNNALLGAVSDSSGFGEGVSFLGEVTADDSGQFSYGINHDYVQFKTLTFTATDMNDNTSEFSENFSVPAGPLTIVLYADPGTVNLWVTDPHGKYIGKDLFGTLYQTILPDSLADYDEFPTNYRDSVTIHYPIAGDYTIDVLTEGRTTYTLGIRLDGSHESIIVVGNELLVSKAQATHTYTVKEYWHYYNGDPNRDDIVNIFDITFLISYLYKDGPAPYPEGAGDSNCDLLVNIFDVTYLITYLYKGGPPPCYFEP